MLYNKIGKALLLCLLLSISTYAIVPKNISFFKDKPRGLAKDFYIYKYLKKSSTSSKDANKLLGYTSRMSMKLFHAFATKIDDPEWRRTSKCLKMKLKTLLKQDTSCIAIKFSTYLATKLNKKELKNIKIKLKDYKVSKYLHVLYNNDPFEEMINADAKQFFAIFNQVGSKYRRKFFDKEINATKIVQIEKNTQINKTIKYTVTDGKIVNFNKSLLHVNPLEPSLSHKALFFLALNALKLNNNTKAMLYLDKAYKKAYYRMDKDKILFWQYKITQDKKYLNELKTSFDINIYTLLSNVKIQNIITPKAFSDKPNYDITDPFGWTKLLRNIKGKDAKFLTSEAKKYLYKNTLPHYSFLMEKASGYKNHYYPMPYIKNIKIFDKKRIALILAIARQESRLIPSALSHSYALGMMQFMPFLAKAIAKQKHFINFELDDMFNPETAYLFADIHLDYLEKYLYNPVFIAYAYNGGIGFTKRVLKSGAFKKGLYEPYMSMELIPYAESRKYAKKVLANYVIYMHLLKKEVSIKTLINNLLVPSKSDKFR